MKETVVVRCRCGVLRGALTGLAPRRVNRVVCYCDDCRAFARFLGGKDILDDAGGSEIVQLSSARLRIDAGVQHLACIRLTGRGLVRWYASCCDTPVGNTLPGGFLPFVGLLHSCLDLPREEPARSEAIGPVLARVHGRDAVGDLSDLEVHPRAPATYVLRLLRMLIAARLRGDHKRSPFFDTTTSAPRATPRVLSASELARLKKA